MRRTMLSRVLTIIGLSLWLFGWSGIEKGRIVEGSSWVRQGIVQLPKVENPHESAIDSGSLIVTVPAEGEFYVAGRRLSAEILAATIRDELGDKPPQAQMIYIRSRASLRFNAVRQVLNIMRQVGFDRLAFVVETGESRREAALETQVFIPPVVKVDPSDHIKVPPPRPETSPRPPPPPPPPPTVPPRMRPKKVAPQPPLGLGALVVEIKVEGGRSDPVIALNRTSMPLPELRSTLSKLFAPGSADSYVFVKASRDVTYADVITIMDEMKGAGADRISLLIDEVEVPRGIPRPLRRPPDVATTDDPGGVPGGAPAPPRIIRKPGGVLTASAIRRVEPKTPPMAKAARVSGPVVVEVVVDEEGDVISARALSGHPLLKDAAVEAAQGWKFTRTELSGVPVKVIGTLTFVFKE